MLWYHWFALTALFICLINCLYHLYRLIRSGRPRDHSRSSGNLPGAIKYAFTGAMSPARKESAYLHLPTYSAGILYHLGTFLSIFLFFLFLLNIEPAGLLRWIVVGYLAVSVVSGLGILIKRIVKQELRALSNPDDYISNILVTSFQFTTALALINTAFLPIYFLLAGLLLLYLPLGKLKHTVYFFAARYHLGFFYGWRGVWPPKKINN